MLAIAGLSLLLTLALSSLVMGIVWMAYRSTWHGRQRWMEATRHQNKLALIVGRWIWFKWIHLDCQYWIVHVDFSKGPIELRGYPPKGSYWSFTYNTWTEVNPSVNSTKVKLEHDGRYRIVLSVNPHESNWIEVRDGAHLGVIYFRIYETSAVFPASLPSVWQNGKLITNEAQS